MMVKAYPMMQSTESSTGLKEKTETKTCAHTFQLPLEASFFYDIYFIHNYSSTKNGTWVPTSVSSQISIQWRRQQDQVLPFHAITLQYFNIMRKPSRFWGVHSPTLYIFLQKLMIPSARDFRFPHTDDLTVGGSFTDGDFSELLLEEDKQLPTLSF